MTARIYFKPRDAWIGAYWKRTARELSTFAYDDGRARATVYRETTLTLWVCLVPCVPIRLTFNRLRPAEVRASARWADIIGPPPARPSAARWSSPAPPPRK